MGDSVVAPGWLSAADPWSGTTARNPDNLETEEKEKWRQSFTDDQKVNCLWGGFSYRWAGWSWSSAALPGTVGSQRKKGAAYQTEPLPAATLWWDRLCSDSDCTILGGRELWYLKYTDIQTQWRWDALFKCNSLNECRAGVASRHHTVKGGVNRPLLEEAAQAKVNETGSWDISASLNKDVLHFDVPMEYLLL